jgi:ABC-type multidrug transport system fused ATPase/permease subunit
MMLSGSLQENISLDRDVDVAGAITAAALDADLARLDGPNTVIGHKGVKLSGGQIQRAAVARALAQSSQLLLLDDVSSALDAPTEREIWTSLRASGRTVVASTYKRFVAEMADQIIVLDHGRVVASGSWTQVSATHQHLFA